MFFMEWFRVGSTTIGLALFAACIYGFTYATKLWNKPIRIAIRVVSVPLGAIASLAVLLLIAGSGCVSHSTPIYSPSGKLAARIEDGCNRTGVALGLLDGRREKKALPFSRGNPRFGWATPSLTAPANHLSPRIVS